MIRRCSSPMPAWCSSRTCSSARTGATTSAPRPASVACAPGGKHNDLENVGYTARHHTFFEMLGNFSFGDYFKRDAIRFAWEFLTERLQLDPARLWVTVFRDDDEAADIWLKEVGVSPGALLAHGREARTSGRWAIPAPAAPAARSSTTMAPRCPGGRRARPMRTATASSRSGIWCSCSSIARADGTLTPLPKPSVDTGMGLERIGRGAAGRALELRHRSLQEPDPRRGGAGAHARIWSRAPCASSPTTSVPARS